MLEFIKSLFSNKGKEEIQEQLAAGAVIIDVRSEREFVNGHLEGSKNIPLTKLDDRLESVKKLNKPIICVCASGMRSSQATNYLKQNGLQAFNGGSWYSLKSLIQS
jgi:rhodanese-related sulfurtransferase